MQPVIKNRVKKISAIFILMVAVIAQSYAGVTLTGTRIIFNEGQKEKVVRTSNKGEIPALVQVWVDDGNIGLEGVSQETPFMAIPPLFRMDSGKGQSVRIRYLGQDLPKDRESLYWFNLLEVPPKNNDDSVSERLSLAFKTKIKLFYRPASLTETSAEQGKNIEWKHTTSNELVAVNPTAYYLSFYSLSIVVGGVTHELGLPMISPFSEQQIKLPSEIKNKKITDINFELIDDYGNGVSYQGKYSGDNGFTIIKK